MIQKENNYQSYGLLAHAATGKKLPIDVMQTRAGFYLGTYGEDGPCSRESAEYWPTREKAQAALETGDWTQHDYEGLELLQLPHFERQR